MLSVFPHAQKVCIAALGLFVAACGGGGDSTGTDDGVKDIQPRVTIQFPPARSLTEAASIRVRGTANGNGVAIASLKVAGVEAVSSDGFAHWSAEVPLTLGDNTLAVDTVDVEGDVDGQVTEARKKH